MERRAAKNGALTKALWDYASYPYGGDRWRKLDAELTGLYGKALQDLKTVEEFWNSGLKRAVAALTDRQFSQDMEEITRMRMEGQFSSSMWRRSYRSSDFGYHAARAVADLAGCLYLETYDQNVKELLTCAHDWVRGFDVRLALELRRGNEEICALVWDAMTGENTEVLLSTPIIRAVIISGRDELVDQLLKLLLAARLQEGLRQQILENADAGSVQTLTRILKLCIDEDLFRYSSVARAFDTWTGLGYGDADGRAAKKCAVLAYDCLTDAGARGNYLYSANTLEAYFALWGMGCMEVADTDRMVRLLLDDGEKYRRILGWLFVSRTDSSRYKMRLAGEYLNERDEETLAWITGCLSASYSVLNTWGYRKEPFTPEKNPDFPEEKEQRRSLFFTLKETAAFIGNKNRTFTGNPFAFTSVTLENTPVISCMMSLAGYDGDEEMTEELAKLRSWMNVQQRQAFYQNLLQPQKKAAHRALLREALQDRSVQVKERAVQRLSDCRLIGEDLEALADSLRSKSSGLRKEVLSVLEKQEPRTLTAVIEKMLSGGEEYQIQAAVELLLGFSETHPELVRAQTEAVERLKGASLSTQTRILFDRLTAGEKKEEETWTQENGFGLYDPKALAEAAARLEEEEKLVEADRLFSARQLNDMLPSKEEYHSLLEGMNAVFTRHADYEYETEAYDGSRSKILFGDASRQFVPIPASFGNSAVLRAQQAVTPEMIPFWEEFRKALGVYGTDPSKMLGLCYTACRWNGPYLYDKKPADWFVKLEKVLAPEYHKAGYDAFQARYWQMADIISLLPQFFQPEEVFPLALQYYRSVLRLIGEENLYREYLEPLRESSYIYLSGRSDFPINHRMAGFWRRILRRTARTPEAFREWFLQEYTLERRGKGEVTEGLTLEDDFRACGEGLLPKETLYERLLTGKNADLRMLTNPTLFRSRGKKILDTWPWAGELVRTAVSRIVEVEEKRGELPTPLTAPAMAIERFEGAEYFCGLLAALGKENFYRGYYYSSETTKQAVLSHLLKRCYPAKGDTPEKLKELLGVTDIKEKRLAEAVMYAPQWAGFAEEILKWPGLKKGVWFFHAHINETFSAEKETEVAIYSPISPQQFNDGAFDREWFLAAHQELGEKRFHILYQSAKYITSGNSAHRRSQLYADAVLGKLDARELEKEIEEKRNQEKLRCYPLVPIREGDRKEALRRYEFIQKFLKESRQFGSQRRESEKRAAATALENLAMTAGFSDVNRMTWYLESEKLAELTPFFDGVELEGILLRLEIDEEGTAALAMEKKGKPLKTLPKALNKNETALAIKETVKELKEQKRRARESLERAMTESTLFRADELEIILNNPVLAPMAAGLIWTLEEKEERGHAKQSQAEPETGRKTQARKEAAHRNGFLQKTDTGLALQDIRGGLSPLPAEAGLRVSHPHDLITAGEWADYMHVLYEKEIKQPFKQVFREYYPITEEERQERTISRRYAGLQVQPQKTVALLKGRGWTVDYEEGLQKVFYRDNLIVRMYALADWFSPADIEAPTLEEIQFFERETGKPVELEAVPPVLFSETMRDIDLAVSVAHVGGVDPEASHSTVEMRTAIARELVSLLKLSNVSFIGAHAKIHGTLADYSVHLGSGVVHGEGIGMIAILPVHSQARGRIFLPFADDDPKTAEIMSRIILLSEDKKIKDPAILSQIRGL